MGFEMAKENVDEAKLNWDLSKTIYVSKSESNGLYCKELESACSAIQDIAGSLAAKTGKMLGPDKDPGKAARDCGNTVIGIAGERGSGKSSFIQSLNMILSDEENLESVYSLGCIEPSNFGSDMNILELFLAQMYSIYNSRLVNLNDTASLYNSPQINGTFKKISQVLSSLRVDKSVYADENPSLAILDNMKKLTNMREMIEELCSQFLQIYNSSIDLGKVRKTSLILFVDDADLTSSKEIYRLMEDVRKYLSGNVIVVIAYRQRQLIESVLEHLINENNDLILQKAISVSNLRSQAEDFIEKVIPKDRTIALYSQSDLIGMQLKDALRGLDRTGEQIKESLIDRYDTSSDEDALLPVVEMKENITVEDWLDRALYRKTLIKVKPVNGQENVSFVWPRNLRELLTLGQIIDEQMPDPWGQATSISPYEQCATNLETYKKYFIENLIEAFDFEKTESLNRWLTASADEKNYVAYSIVFKMLYAKLEDARNYPDSEGLVTEWAVVDNLLSIDLMHPENITIGDVYIILNKLVSLSFDNELDVYFGYALKMLYSIECLGFVLQMLQLEKAQHNERKGADHRIHEVHFDHFPACIEESEAWTQYLKITNMSILPAEPEQVALSRQIQIPTEDAFEHLKGILCRMSNEEVGGKIGNSVNRNDSDGDQDVEDPEAWQNYSDDGWNDVSVEMLGQVSLGAYKDGMDLFISPTAPYNGRVYRASRPMRRNYLNSSDVDSIRLKTSSNYNRLIFLDSKIGLEKSESYRAGRYCFNLLNVIVNPKYLKRALRSIIEGDKGAYVFYSLSDLDVLTALTYRPESENRSIINQVRRLNTVFAAAVTHGLDFKPCDSRMMPVEILYERKLFHRIAAPFVIRNNGSFVFSETIMPYKDLVAIFELSDFIAKHLRQFMTPSHAILQRIVKDVNETTKQGALRFSKLLEEEIASQGGKADASLMEAVKILSTKKTQYSSSRKALVTRAIEGNAAAAWSAYKKWDK